MFDNELFEMAIVVVVVIAAISLLVDSISKALLGVTGWRRRLFQKMVYSLLSDETYGTLIAQRFLRHPVVRGPASSGRELRIIDEATFVAGLASAIGPDQTSAEASHSIVQSIAALKDGRLKQRLSLVVPRNATELEAEGALRQWFTSSLQATEQQFTSDLRATYWIVAAICTVLINVSPLKIIERTTAKDSLRSSYALAVPELSPLLYDPGAAIPVSLPAEAPLPETMTDVPGASASPVPATGTLSSDDLKAMRNLYECSQNSLGLPIGWSWMAGAASSLRRSIGPGSLANAVAEQSGCQRALFDASVSDSFALKRSVDRLNLTTESFKRQYGPSFETDSPLIVLFGWLLTTMIAATAAPSASDLLQRYLRR